MRCSSYIFRLAVEADQRSFARVQVLGGGNGCGEEREWAAQHFEARVYVCLSDVFILIVYRQIYPTSARARVATTIGVECLCGLGGGRSCADLNAAATGAIKKRLS
jgi:hypothetical protein